MGAGGAEALDASNMLKPALSRGEIRVVGATTIKEYRNIEKDAALTRRSVCIRMSDIEDGIMILRGLRDKYELFHGVRIQTERLFPRLNFHQDISANGSCRIRRLTLLTAASGRAHRA